VRQAWRAADRAAAVLGAARGWRAAGLIDETVFAALAADHPQAGPNLARTWRALVFICVAVGVWTATALSFFSFGVRAEGDAASILLVAGLALVVLTDVVIDRSAFRPSGADAATSLLAVSYLVAAAFILTDRFHVRGTLATQLAFAWSALVLGLAAWRWGFRLYAAAAAGAVLLLAAQFPSPRLAWIAAAALLALGASVALARHDYAPSHRDGIELVRVTALTAIYVAVNYLSTEKCLLEEIARAVGAPHHRPGALSLQLAGVASALYPLGLLVWGLRSRELILIDAGILTAALSLATLRFYVHVGPLWAVLALSGAAIAGASLVLERWLRAGRNGERAGFTAAPLYDESRREQLLPIAAALALAPEARSLPEEPRGVHGGGGGFGGGGASSSF
jgi:hypothetical protein